MSGETAQGLAAQRRNLCEARDELRKTHAPRTHHARTTPHIDLLRLVEGDVSKGKTRLKEIKTELKTTEDSLKIIRSTLSCQDPQGSPRKTRSQVRYNVP